MTVPPRFGVLRLVATLFKIFAWIVLVLSVLGALALGLAGPLLRDTLVGAEALSELFLLDEAGGIIAGLILITMGLVGFLSLFAVGDSIQMQLAIEENTRLTAALLLRLEEDNRSPESKPYTYYGEVVK